MICTIQKFIYSINSFLIRIPKILLILCKKENTNYKYYLKKSKSFFGIFHYLSKLYFDKKSSIFKEIVELNRNDCSFCHLALQ